MKVKNIFIFHSNQHSCLRNGRMKNNQLHEQSRGQSSKYNLILHNSIMIGCVVQPHLLLIVFANEKIPKVQLGLKSLLQI